MRRRRSSRDAKRGRRVASTVDQPDLELSIEALTFGGAALARRDGQVVFVDGGAPGDRLRARIVARHRSYLRAESRSVLEAGPSRREPRCDLVGRCGGCQWQHVDDAEQSRQKAAILRSALRELRVEAWHFAAAPAPFGYRRRCRLSWHRRLAGVDIGFRPAKSRGIVAVSSCPLLVPVLERAMLVLQGALVAAGLAGPARGSAALLADAEGMAVHASVRVASGEAPDVAALLQPPIVGLTVMHADRRVERAGASSVALGDGLRGSAEAFAQANAAQDGVLRRTLAAAVDALAPRRVLELHAGVGNLTRVVAQSVCPRGGAVTAVELSPVATALLSENVAGLRVDVRQQPAEAALAGLVAGAEDERPDLVLLDPPREGCAELLADLVTLAPRAIIYVSCDPMTLARDLRALAAAGYAIRRVCGIDMMPQTYHIETLVILEREASPATSPKKAGTAATVSTRTTASTRTST